jgi:hypothetical protein
MMSIEPSSEGNGRRSGHVPDISVVIPAYNQAKRLPGTLHAAENYFGFRNLSREILVVDDSSQDDTVQICPNMRDKITGLEILNNGRYRGKGFSVRHGISTALCELAFTDADTFGLLAEIILPLVSKIDKQGYFIYKLNKTKIFDLFPEKVLALLCEVLPDNTPEWPYGTGGTLKRIGEINPALLKDIFFIDSPHLVHQYILDLFVSMSKSSSGICRRPVTAAWIGR